MNKTQARVMAQMELTGIIMRNDPSSKLYNVIRGIQDLAKYAKSLHKRYENACNYQWAATEDYEARTDKIEAKAIDVASSLGIQLGLQRDPRGWPFICKVAGTEIRLG